MMIPYDPARWYWVGGDEARAYSSAAMGYVPADDAAYLAWLAAGGLPTRIGSEADLMEVLAAAGVLKTQAMAISDRQFAQVLALDGIITRDEAIAWAARGDLPTALSQAVASLSDGDERFAAEMLLSSATTYERHHPLVAVLAALLKPGGYSAAELDDLWTRAAAL